MQFSCIMSYIATFILGIFTQSITNDSSSIIQIRMLVMDLTLLCGSWPITKPYRLSDLDERNICKIKEILCKLNVYYTDLFCGSTTLKKLIEESLEQVRSYEADTSAPQNRPEFIAVELLGIWDSKVASNEQLEQIQVLESFLQGNFLKRMWLRILELTKRLKIFLIQHSCMKW